MQRFSRNGRSLSCTFWCVASFLLAGPQAAVGESLDDALTRGILESGRTLTEVQRFCEQRVRRMPEIRDQQSWERSASRIRRDVLDRVVFRGEAVRWRDAKTRIEWLDSMDGGEGYRIKKLRYEALPGLWIPALLYEPLELSGRVPVVMNVNGHDGKGKAADYKQIRCINQAKRGMLALNVEWLGMGQLGHENFRHYRMNQIDLCGTSGLAPYYLAMQRGLDVLLGHDHADPSRVAVAGLSGGGWQTIFISSLDTRVTLANPVAGYSSFLTRVHHQSDLGDSEQTPVDLATVADYTHLTALMAPRPTLLTFNAEDNCCFAAPHALQPLLDAARPAFAVWDRADHLRHHVNHDPGTHNFEQDNREALYRMLRDHFAQDKAGFSAEEIPCQDELKTAEQLNVPLPERNLDFHRLAERLSKSLPREADLPAERAAATAWQTRSRERLRRVARIASDKVEAQRVGTSQAEGYAVTRWKLGVGEAWTVPAVELSPSESRGTTILLSDEGRGARKDRVKQLLDAGQRVLLVDPFYLGESKIQGRDFLYALLVSAVGERPLGIQAGQVAAVARWLRQRQETLPLTLEAVGPRTSLIGLVAAASEAEGVDRVRLTDCYGSLKQVIESNGSVDQTPELFCFGLLEAFDIRQLVALVAPRPVELSAPSERVRRELADLAAWYKTLGRDFEPLTGFSPTVQAAEWPEFRGPEGQGHARSDGLPVEWDATKNVVWKTPLPGEGWSSPILHRGQLFLTAAVPRDDDVRPDYSLRVLAVDPRRGEIVWNVEALKQPAENAPRIHDKNSHASPTPIAAGDRLFVHFGHRGTACLDLDGNVIWRQTSLGYRPVHGNGGSPILVDGRLIFSIDGAEQTQVVALDAATGAVAWQTDRGSTATKKFSFTTPLAISAGGRTLVISPGSDVVCALDAATGEEVWRVRYDGYSVIPRPVFGHGLVFICTGYNRPSLLAIDPTGQGDVTDTHVRWTTNKSVPHTPSLLLVEDELYMVSDRGIASCLDARSGEVHWTERVDGNYSASPVYSGGRIYLQNEAGQGTVLRAAKQFRALARNDLGERSLASYAVGGSALFIRTAEHLYRIED